MPDYTQKPCYAELVLLGLTAVGHLAIELLCDGLKGVSGSLARPQYYFNIGACILWASYLFWRLFRTPGAARAWGFRKDTFAPAIKASLLFAAIAAIPLLAFGIIAGTWPLPATIWILLLLYPIWGIAQQFALQALVTRNLRELVPRLPFRALATSVCFSAVHFPEWRLMILVLVAGFGFTWIYEKHCNLWAIGIVHGILGSLACYLVLDLDASAQILSALRH